MYALRPLEGRRCCTHGSPVERRARQPGHEQLHDDDPRRALCAGAARFGLRRRAERAERPAATGARAGLAVRPAFRQQADGKVLHGDLDGRLAARRRRGGLALERRADAQVPGRVEDRGWRRRREDERGVLRERVGRRREQADALVCQGGGGGSGRARRVHGVREGQRREGDVSGTVLPSSTSKGGASGGRTWEERVALGPADERDDDLAEEVDADAVRPCCRCCCRVRAAVGRAAWRAAAGGGGRRRRRRCGGHAAVDAELGDEPRRRRRGGAGHRCGRRTGRSWVGRATRRTAGRGVRDNGGRAQDTSSRGSRRRRARQQQAATGSARSSRLGAQDEQGTT